MMDKWTDGQELARFAKSLAEDVRLSRYKWAVGEYVGVRVWSKVRPGDIVALVPTENGLCLAVDLLPDLRAAIDKAIVALGGDELPVEGRAEPQKLTIEVVHTKSGGGGAA